MHPAACRADAGDQESVAAGTKAMRQAHRVAQFQDLVVAELDDPVARGAVEVIVGRVAIVVLEGGAGWSGEARGATSRFDQ